MQELIVTGVVTGAACYLALRYMPKAVLDACGNVLVRVVRNAGGIRLATRLEKALEKATWASACGSCGGCSGKDSAAPMRNGITPEALRRTARR